MERTTVWKEGVPEFPLRADDDGQVFDARGKHIADCDLATVDFIKRAHFLTEAANHGGEGWTKIENIPAEWKDGRELDLWACGRRIANCRWGKPSHANWGDRYGCDQNLPKQWITRDGCALDRRNGKPTHARLLPSPPKLESHRRKG